MELWASLIAGAVPALVTAAALSFQQRRNNEHALTIHRLQVQDRTRERMHGLAREAHLNAFRHIGAARDVLVKEGFALAAKIRDGEEWEPLTGVPAPVGSKAALDGAIDAVALACSPTSTEACLDAVLAVYELGGVVSDQAPTFDAIHAAVVASDRALVRYRAAARVELASL